MAGVAGAGTMGRGIAQVLAQGGVRTLLFDAQPGAAQKARDSIAQSLGRLVERDTRDAARIGKDFSRAWRRAGGRRWRELRAIMKSVAQSAAVQAAQAPA